MQAAFARSFQPSVSTKSTSQAAKAAVAQVTA